MSNYTTPSSAIGQFAVITGSTINADILTNFDIFLNCFLLHVLSLLGVLTNILNIIVLSKHSFQETTNIILFSLSVCDLLCSILQPFRKFHCFAERLNPVVGLTLKSISMVYMFVLPDIFVSASVLHTTLIAIERLVAVCFPLLVSRIFTPFRVKWTVLFLYVLAIGMLSPTLFLSKFIWLYDNKYNTTRGAVVLSQFYVDNSDILNKYASNAVTHFFVTCPVLIILSCSAVTGFKLTVGRRKALSVLTSSNNGKQTKDIKVVKMLLTVCVVNASVAIPTVAINLFLLYSNVLIVNSGQLSYVLRSVIGVIYQLIVTINFVIYVTMSSKFAKTLNTIFCNKELTKSKT